ncbi:methyl-accepting chemotaxis protein [Halovivax limisalsi]|uniref:methyl-accepting chemotaxis protein n=1 Tax=Halovivax limisalsi TaxID=1453760 RepID=UPI001FFC2B1C|nr:methyl-accepting chemotaxis protein [Halovivax limisalsi]
MIGKLRTVVPTPVRRSYALKFGIALLVLGLSVGLIGLVGTTMITDSVEERTLQTQEEQAAQEAMRLDSWDEQNSQVTYDIARTPVLQSDDPAAIQDFLDELTFDFEGAHYVDGTTHEILASTTSSAETLDDINFTASSALAPGETLNVKRTEPYMNDPQGQYEDPQPVVAYHVGITGSDAVLIVTMNLADYGSETSDDTVVTVVDDENRIVADDLLPGFDRSKSELELTYPAFLRAYDDPDDFLADATAGDAANRSGAAVYSGSGSSALQGHPYNFTSDEYVGAYHGTEMGWTVLTHTPTESAYGFVDTVNTYGLYATIGGVLLIGLFGVVLGRNTATSIDRLTDKVAEMESGNLDVEFESPRIDNIGRLYDGFAEMRDQLKSQITEAEEARAEAEAERERVEAINEDLQRTAASYCDVMAEASDGDLTVRMDPDETDNETMADIGRDFNAMLTEIEATVENLNRFASEVATASEQVTASSEEVRSASEQVSESVQEISDGASEQYDSLRSVDNEMNNLSTTTEEIAASSNEVADVAERTARTGREGRDSAREAIDAVEQLEAERESVVEEFERLRSDVGEIDQLVDRVSEIAEQTNMLALNANIEASRSAGGDDDGGFAAVAAEVKELSQDVKAATEEIDEQLEDIQTQTERSADEVERTSEEITRVGDLVGETVDALEEIAEYAQETNDGVQEISAATEEQAASTEEVVAMVDEVATISEQTTEEAESVAAAAEEQTTAMTEVSNSADQLTEQAMTLSEALDRFETDADPDASTLEPDGRDDSADEPDDGETFSFETSTATETDSPDGDADADAEADADEVDATGDESASDDPADDDGEATWELADDDEGETFSLDG